MIDDNIVSELADGHCPDCGHRGYVVGPRGGAAINIECGNVKCLARFNITCDPMNGARIVIAQRIPRSSEGGSTNWGYQE